MSEPPRVQNETHAAASSSGRSIFVHHLRVILVILVSVIAFVFDVGEFLKLVKAKDVASTSMFSIPTEITSQFAACNYHALFFCDLKPGVAKCRSEHADDEELAVCIAMVTSPPLGAAVEPIPKWKAIPYLNVALYSIVMLPRLPNAIDYMLEKRWQAGHLEFGLGVTFVFAYVTLMFVALRSKSPMKLWYFALAVVYGPYVILGVFWLLQHAVLGTTAGFTAGVAFLTHWIGTTGCVLACVTHDSESLAKMAKGVAKGARV